MHCPIREAVFSQLLAVCDKILLRDLCPMQEESSGKRIDHLA